MGIWDHLGQCSVDATAKISICTPLGVTGRLPPGCQRIYSAITVNNESSKKTPASRKVALKSVFSMPRRVR